jgi:GTPase SAR1 family protein
MVVETLMAMGGAKLGEQLLNNVMDVGGGALKEYLKGFFKDKLGDIVDKFQLKLKAAMKEAIGEFMKLFIKELQNSGVSDENINRYYINSKSIESFIIKDKDTRTLLGKAFDAGFKGFDDVQINQLKKIWTAYFKYQLMFPAKFNWESLLDNYQQKVKEIRRANPKLREILDSEIRESLDGGIKKIAPTLESLDDGIKNLNDRLKENGPISTEFDLDGYRESLQESYGDLKLGGLDNSNDKHDIQLLKIFVEQNVKEGLPPDPSPNPDFDELTQDRQKSAEPVRNVLRDEKCQRAVLLGDTGSGKSSLLQYLALDWVEGNTDRLPLLIELREYAIDRPGAKNFLDFLSTKWQLGRHQLHEHLQTQPSLVMFDGLDEIFDRHVRESTSDLIAQFARRYPKAKIVITSRVVGYDPDRLRRAKFQHFTLQKFDESQIQEFINKWHESGLEEDPQQEQLKQQLKDEIDRYPAIRILANNPLLLTLMADLNQQESLPTQRVDLYDRASRLLLHNWDFDGKNLKLDPSLEAIEADEKQEILGKIAYQMQSQEAGLAGNLLDAKGLNQILIGYLKENDFQEPMQKASRLIKQLRTRSFILCAYGSNAYGFVHRTFLEYFCARDFVRRLNEEPYPSLEELRDDVFDRHWQDETWDQVLQFICGLLKPEEAESLVDFLMMKEVDRANYLDDRKLATTGAVQHLRLATECWAEVKSLRSGLVTDKLKDKLKKEIESQSNNPLDSDAAKLLLDSIARYYHSEPETLDWLKDIALNNQHKWVQSAAVMSIAEYYHKEKESKTLTWLKDTALNNQHKWVQSAAIMSIVQYYYKESETLDWLQYIALNNQHERVRLTVVRSIAEYHHKEPKTLIWLKDIALNNQHEDVRWQAVRSIAKYYYHNKSETLIWLEDTALDNQDKWIRRAALESIAKYYIQDDSTFKLLCQIASQDLYRGKNDYKLRKIALEALVENYIDRPEVIELLRDRSTQEPEEKLRIWAREQLKNIG